MEEFLKQALKTNIFTKMGKGGGGCINQGEGYNIDSGQIFVKFNEQSGARVMFDGEYEGLKAMTETKTIRVPKPIDVFNSPKNEGAMIVMEYLEFKSLSRFAKELGERVADLHLYNLNLAKSNLPGYVSRFGFHTTTCCGYLPLDNTWKDDWITFYTNNRLQNQLDMVESNYKDKEAKELWVQLKPKIPKLFEGIVVKPSLLHGDLWSGNAAETTEGPVIFDPASFFGHSEFDLAIAGMFGGFNHSFFNAYHKKIPKELGYDDRKDLYQLFHYLNHWNHFGGGYRGSSISIMHRLVKKF